MAISEIPSHTRCLRLRSKREGPWLVSPALRERLIADAATDGTNLTNTIHKILCRRYRVEYVQQRAATTKPGDGIDQIQLSLPVNVWQAIAVSARARGVTDQQEIRLTLSAHFGLRMPAKVRLPRAPHRTAAA